MRWNLFSPFTVTTESLEGVVDIDASDTHQCAVTANKRIYCWGSNSRGAIGDGTTTTRSAPVDLGFSDVLSVATGHHLSCALHEAGTVTCWGWNSDGQVGDGTLIQRESPTAIGFGGTAVAIYAGSQYACLTDTDRAPLVLGRQHRREPRRRDPPRPRDPRARAFWH